MSTKQASLPTVDAAVQHLTNNLRGEVFFGTLQQYGIVPQNEKEALDLLATAERLRPIAAAEKQAADSRFAAPLQALDNVQKPVEPGLAIKQAAAYYLQDPATYDAILAIKQAELQEAAAQ